MKTRILLILSIATLYVSASAEVMIEQANLSGTIRTRPMSKQPALYNRGVEKVAVVGYLAPNISRSHVGISMFNNKFSELEIPSKVDISLISSELSGSEIVSDKIEFVDESELFESLEQNIKISKWDGKAKILDNDESNSLISVLTESGYDTILYITERNTSDFIGSTNQHLPPKGLYTRPKIKAIYAVFEVRLIDLDAKKEIKHTSYVQGTVVRCDDIDFEDDPEVEKAETLAAIEMKIKEAYKTASLQVIKMLKANK